MAVKVSRLNLLGFVIGTNQTEINEKVFYEGLITNKHTYKSRPGVAKLSCTIRMKVESASCC